MISVFDGAAARAAVASVALWAAAIGWARPAEAQEAFVFHRGVALFHPLASATRVAGSYTEFVPQPFSDARHRLTEAQLDVIAKARFDFVRLPVDPGPFLALQGAARDALDDVLRQNVQMILAHGLNVIVDFHPNPQETNYRPQMLVSGADTPIFRSYCAMLARTVGVLDALHTSRVALELMNEPEVGWSRAGYAAWQAMAEEAYKSARNAAPHLPLVLSGGNGGNAQGLVVLDPKLFASDSAAIFTFHFYFPYEFTMQSERDAPERSILLDVPYPADSRPLSDSMSALEAQLDQSRASVIERTKDTATAFAKLSAYRLTGFNRDTIRSDFDQVTAWAHANAITPSRIFLGEFGVIRRFGIYHGARDDERALWLRDVRREAEQHGFIWSLWAYSGTGGMEITDGPDWIAIDPVTLKALGLR